MKIGDVNAILIFVLLIKAAPVEPYSSKFHKYHSYPNSFSAAKSKNGAHKLNKPLIGDDGRVYACSEKTLYAFRRNATIAWSLDLNYLCSSKVSPVIGGAGQIFLVVDNAVLKIDSWKVGTRESPLNVFYSPEAGAMGVGKIVGIAVSISYSCVLINVKKRGLFAYRLDGHLMWSAGPIIYQHGYQQGCRKNVTGCYFSSVPIIDHCEASIYISNNQGELYSLSILNPHFRWVQDLSSFGKVLIISAGNNGVLYVTIPVRTVVLALDVSRGNVLWQGIIGPLSTPDYAPVVNIDGWICIGSLDGFLYSFSPKGVLKKFPKAPQVDAVIQANPILDCSGYAVYISHTTMEGKSGLDIGEYTHVSAMKPKNVVFKMLNPTSGTVYWFESYPGPVSSNLSSSDLKRFLLDEGTLLAFIITSRYGNPFSCRSTYHKLASSCSKIKSKDVNTYTGNVRSIMVFLLLESILLILLAAAVRFCFIFWKKKKLQNQELGKFLEKRRSLWVQKKVLDRTITELKQRTSDEAVANEVLETLNNMVKERETISRKLSTSYSLRGDEAGSSKSRSLLPLQRTKSFSFQGAGKENVELFHTFSSDASFESSNEGDSDEELTTKGKGKAPMEVYSSTDDDIHETDYSDTDEEVTPSGSGSNPARQLNPVFIQHPLDQIEEIKVDEKGEKENRLSGSSSSIRRRSSTLLTNKMA
ncbi:hypothetical protein Leryth_025412 [Lithospermum erythrorhizon]|nr:hypothetical protein Leryth_025412 [Lithospermum erythrorhizon]